VRPSTPPTFAPASPLPGANDRVTVLLVGVDNTRAGERGLTDTLIVASFDPVGRSLTMISIPRDTGRLPYYAGGEYSRRINTLMQSAARDPGKYPDGPMGTLMNEISYLVGVPIDYYAQIDIAGFTALVDMVGGVDVVLDSPIRDATYQFSPTEMGFFLEAGPHHLDGKLATAYARSRHGPGNSDYERARRQQQILLALRTKMNDPRLMANLPGVLYVLSNIVRTNAPLDRLPDLVSIGLASANAEPRRVVLAPPRYAQAVVNAAGDRTFMTMLRMDAVAELSVELFGPDSRYYTAP
jgi:LCP family protein required for cell wall assembly